MDHISCSLGAISDTVAAILHWPTNVGIEFRRVSLRTEPRTDLLAVFVDGLADSELVRRVAIEPLEHAALQVPGLGRIWPRDLDGLLAVPRIESTTDMETVIRGVMAGATALFFDGAGEAALVDTRAPQTHPAGSTVPENPFKDQFGADLTENVALIRKRLRDPRLIAEPRKLPGERAAEAALVYMAGRAEPRLIAAVRDWMDGHAGEEAMRRGFQAGIAARYGFVPHLLTSSWPDKAAALLDAGYVTVLVDGLRLAYMAPVTAPSLLYAPGDHLLRRPVAVTLRLLRVVPLAVIISGSALVVALTNYHQEMIPTPFMLGLASVRENAPLPIIGEVLLLELMHEMVWATITRLPAPVSSGASLVAYTLAAGLLVFGGIVAPLPAMVAVLAVICTLGLPEAAIGHMSRTFRWPMIFGAAIFGLFGLAATEFLLYTYLTQHESFGVPFLGETGPKLTSPGRVSSRQKGGKLHESGPAIR